MSTLGSNLGSAKETGEPGDAPMDFFVANRCAICGQDEGVLLFEVDAHVVARCPHCRLVYTKLRPSRVIGLYDEAYYNSPAAKGGYANYFAGAAINRQTFRRRLAAIEKELGHRGRILDVGCALGDFLLVAKEAGWQAFGVEVSPWAAEYARRQNDLTVTTGSLQNAAFEDGSFEVVTLYDVIEHADDPVGLLREVRRILVPGGLVHIVTPNVDGCLAKLLGRRWYHFKPGEHLYYFGPSTLDKVMRMGELTPIRCSAIGSVMTPAYMLDRLRYYSPALAGASGAVMRWLSLSNLPFYVRAGELQAWARRLA